MFTMILLASLALLCVQDSKPAPSEELVAATCATLEKTLTKDVKPESAAEVLRGTVGVVDPRVIAVLDAKGLRVDNLDVRGAVVEVLARMEHPAALKALDECLKRDKKALDEAPPRLAAMLRAIARHGDESSIPTLVEDLFQSPDRGVITARILGLGHIRSPKSVDELIRLMRSSPHPRVADHMGSFRLALVVLTGEDKGTDQALWLNWYGDHQAKLTIAAEPPALPRELRRRWNQYWGLADEEDAPAGKGRKGKGK